MEAAIAIFTAKLLSPSIAAIAIFSAWYAYNWWHVVAGSVVAALVNEFILHSLQVTRRFDVGIVALGFTAALAWGALTFLIKARRRVNDRSIPALNPHQPPVAHIAPAQPERRSTQVNSETEEKQAERKAKALSLMMEIEAKVQAGPGRPVTLHSAQPHAVPNLRPGEPVSTFVEQQNQTHAASAARMAATVEVFKTGRKVPEYRDHRLEWMIKSGGIEVVLAGLRDGNIRFPWPNSK